jgi:hypothetical protein
MEHALPRTWSLCMTSENHGTVGPAGCTFSHAPEKHERVLVVEAPAGAHAPVAELKGYVDGEPAVTWFDRDNMPRVGTKLFAAPVAAQLGQVAALGSDLRQVIAFLMGESELEGVSFGERHPTKAGAFWWRLNLRAAMHKAAGARAA